MLLVLVVGSGALSALITDWVRGAAIRSGLMDVPNARSSHEYPTPRGGGLGIVIATSLAMASLAVNQGSACGVIEAVIPGFLCIGIVGLVDDRRGLAPLVRLTAHFLAAVWLVLRVPEFIHFRDGTSVVILFTAILLAVSVVWAVNLFNFMDGIDGLAATQGVMVGGFGALILVARGYQCESAVLVCVAAACLGFLRWNWPPAKIFMGDVGSGALGFVLVGVPLYVSAPSWQLFWAWAILGGTFVVDATVTLAKRTLRGERVFVAHRSHAYQRLARRFRSHRKVTILYCAITGLWLAPLAFWASSTAAIAPLIAVIALSPLIALALAIGAGAPESPEYWK